MQQSATRLVIVRHGETAWNLVSRIQGHTDIPLNERGLWQAERAGQALRDEGIHAIYTSDLRRAADTAAAIGRACELPVTTHEGLRERHFGRFEGYSHDDIATRWPDEARRWRNRDPDYGPQGGEILQHFYDRVITTAHEIARDHPGETVVLVAHGGVLDCFYRAATHVGLSVPRTWKIANASINRLLRTDEGFALIGWADTRHLEGDGLDETTDGSRSPALALQDGLSPAR